MPEKVDLYLDRSDPRPKTLADGFAEIFASLDERPRELEVSVHAANDIGARVSCDLVRGEPVFTVDGVGSSSPRYRGRYLAEHKVPLVFSLRRPTRLRLTPTTANRVKVRS